jgi:RNA 2',3'-cyclic 3'-phosphodiesterase
MTERRGRRPHVDPTEPGRRLFVAVPLPQAATDEVAAIVERVRAMALPPGARDVRWVRLDTLHLTLRFLGPTPPDQVESTADAVAAAAASAAGPFEVELAGAGAFPSGRRPRTLWIDLGSGTDELADLARATEHSLEAAGWPREGRPFRPHLTLARSDGVSVGPLVADRLAAAMADRRIAWTVDALGLFESITGGGPARYLPITVHRLAGSPGADDGVYHHRAPDLSEVEFRIDS